MQYSLDDEHELVPNTPPFLSIKPGSGPRHLTFAPNGKFAYLLNEMAGTVTVLAFNAAKGTLSEVETVPTLPEDFKGRNTSAEIAVHPSGKFLYASNRGLDSITEFAVDADTGKLTLVGRQSTMGKTPRNFAIEPTGHFLVAANQDTDNLAVFSINQDSGKLESTSQVSGISMPVCVKFLSEK
jgi:6-phosphogluconolactonase